MSDEIPPAPSETDDASKSETIRITLPAKTDQPVVKRETVRINLPGKPFPTPPPPTGISPKKETTKILPVSEMPDFSASAAPAAPPASKPFLPPPPKPPSPTGAPLPPVKPASGLNPPPKPPSMGARPTVPLKPAPSGAARPPGGLTTGSGINPSDPMTQKPAAPKKETARITLPPEGQKPGMPKATIKMQQTQPLVSRPAPQLSQSGTHSVPALSTSAATGQAEPDGAVNILSIIAVIVSLVSAGLVYWVYSASALS